MASPGLFISRYFGTLLLPLGLIMTGSCKPPHEEQTPADGNYRSRYGKYSSNQHQAKTDPKKDQAMPGQNGLGQWKSPIMGSRSKDTASSCKPGGRCIRSEVFELSGGDKEATIQSKMKVRARIKKRLRDYGSEAMTILDNFEKGYQLCLQKGIKEEPIISAVFLKHIRKNGVDALGDWILKMDLPAENKSSEETAKGDGESESTGEKSSDSTEGDQKDELLWYSNDVNWGVITMLAGAGGIGASISYRKPQVQGPTEATKNVVAQTPQKKPNLEAPKPVPNDFSTKKIANGTKSKAEIPSRRFAIKSKIGLGVGILTFGAGAVMAGTAVDAMQLTSRGSSFKCRANEYVMDNLIQILHEIKILRKKIEEINIDIQTLTRTK